MIADGARFAAESAERFDVVIVDSTDPQGPGAVLFTEPFYRDVRRLLNPGGIMATQCGNPSIRPDELVDTQAAQRGAGFALVDYFLPVVPTYIGGAMALGFATDDPAAHRASPAELRGAGRAAGAALLHAGRARGRVRPSGLDDRAGGPLAMARIAIGGLHHETNSFAPQPATFERFVEADGWPPLLRGAAMLPGSAGHQPRDHRLHRCGTGRRARAGAAGLGQCVPVRVRSPRMRSSGWRRCCSSDLAAAGPLDGLFLDLHGAMVTEHLADGEGELLRRSARRSRPRCRSWRRSTCTPTSPRRWSTHSDALVAYRTYPHIDLAVTGARCLPLLERLMAGGPWPRRGAGSTS